MIFPADTNLRKRLGLRLGGSIPDIYYIAAYGFLVAERSAFPPSGPGPGLLPSFTLPQGPAGWQPQGSALQAGATW
jgi:hypothetical protein